MKNRWLIPLIGIMAINFVAAYGSYSNFSIGDLLDSIDSSTMILGSLFIIFFAILNFALSRFFINKITGLPNKGIAGTISLVMSILIIYGINKMGMDFEDFFYNIGFSEGILGIFLPIIILIGAIYFIMKFKIRGFLLFFGISFLLISTLTDWVYEKGLLTIIGVVMLLIGLLLWWRHKKKEAFNTTAEAVGRGGWGATKGVGRGIGWTGKKIGKGAGWTGKKVGRAGFNKVQELRDPRLKLANYQQKEKIKQEKILAQRRLKFEKQDNKQKKIIAKQELETLKNQAKQKRLAK